MSSPKVTRPPKPLVPGVARVTVKQTYGGSLANVFHIQKPTATPFTVAEMNQLNNSFASELPHLLTPLASSLTTSEIDILDIGSATGLFITYPSAIAGGDISSGNLPSNVACCVSWHQDLHFRGGHPRTYLSGIRPGDLADTKHFTAAFYNAVAAGAEAFRSGFPTASLTGAQLVMVRYPYDKLANTWGTPSVHPITSASVNPRIDSQRRRLGKV